MRPATGGSDLSQQLRRRAAAYPARIVLPEGDDSRVVRAAALAHGAGIARVTLLGEQSAIRTAAAEQAVDLDGIACHDPAEDPRRADLAERYRAARPRDDISPSAAVELMGDPIFFGSMLVESGAADGLVAGARTSTAATIEPALRVRRLSPGMGPIASCFLMDLPAGRGPRGVGDVLVLADCALNPDPSPALLARIAIVAAGAARDLCGLRPRVAMLSSSTLGSADHARVRDVRAAVAQVRERDPQLCVDGELQVDAALVAEVARAKAPGSPVAGRANVLVFPDLESGNIGYKLVERLAGARAIGPIFFGLNWPVNDLSRGCGAEEIVDVVAVTAIQCHTRGGHG